MAASTHLSPQERYQVIHFIREQFMKDSNPEFTAVSDAYLKKLPKGTKRGEFRSKLKRDFGPALASQLGRNITSALTVKLQDQTSMAYNLHSMDSAEIWQGGFLDLNSTQHTRGRGEGVPTPSGKLLQSLSGWRWGHDGKLDYPRQGLLPRGPLPEHWMNYRGHYLNDGRTILSYSIDGREILELPSWSNQLKALKMKLIQTNSI